MFDDSDRGRRLEEPFESSPTVVNTVKMMHLTTMPGKLVGFRSGAQERVVPLVTLTQYTVHSTLADLVEA
jgi:hypothetical protein